LAARHRRLALMWAQPSDHAEVIYQGVLVELQDGRNGRLTRCLR
jgi:hypothetical protein